MIVRNQDDATILTTVGTVLVNDQTIVLNSSASGKNDNVVAITRPAPVRLDELGLIESGAFEETPPPGFARKDELIMFDNSLQEINKSSAGTFYYLGGQWRKFGESGDFGSTLVEPGDGFLIRKADNGVEESVFWVNRPNFNP